MKRKIYHAGQEFNSWTLLHKLPSTKNQTWLCRCKCGKEAAIATYILFTNKSKQCRNCYIRPKNNGRLHGHSRKGKVSREFAAWNSLIDRCTNENNAQYHLYGGRGITVSPEFLGDNGFVQFFEHVGEKPGREYSLDRIDNNKGYERGNLKWSTRVEQGNNRRTNINIEYNGKTQTVAMWAEELGIDRHIIYDRLRRGWSDQEALSTLKRNYDWMD